MEVCSVNCFFLLTAMFYLGCCLLTYSMLHSFFSTLQLHLNFLYILCIVYMLDVLCSVAPELFLPSSQG